VPLERAPPLVHGDLLWLVMGYPPASDQLLGVVDAVGTLEADLNQPDRLGQNGAGAWTKRYEADFAALTGAPGAARAALGLSKA